MLAGQEEYSPLVGSAMNPSKKHAFMYGGGAAIMVLFMFAAFSGSNPAAVVQTQTAAVAPAVQQLAEGGAAGEVVHFSTAQFDFIYNILSFAIAAMGASTVFFFFQFTLVAKKYRTAMIITALVTLIAFYHYVRIFNSFNTAYVSQDNKVTSTGIPFNDAYRYVDWLLTVPLLLMELILVMDLSKSETRDQCIKLGGAAALMIVLGYPGEISDDNSTRWAFWAAAMAPFLFIVYSLFVGLSGSVASQPEEARGLVDSARWVTVLSWCTYPVVFTFPMLGLNGAGARTGIQVGYSIADVIAKPLLGLVVWQIAARKSKMLG